MAVSFEDFFRAIAKQESGGSYSAVGVQTKYGRAYGKYQVLDSNIPSWTRKYYGKALTPQQFLNNRAAQDAVARGVLKSYYNKWGPRGAAAAWYAGPGNHNLYNSTAPQAGGPSIKDYVDSVMAHAGEGSAGSAAAVSNEKVTPMARNEAAEDYGFVESLLDSNPELKKLFNRAVKGGWTPGKFQAEVRDTKWWKQHSEAERKYLVLRFGDPATAKQNEQQAYVRVRQLANQLGIVETEAMRKKLKTWAYNVYAKGWSEEQLRYEIGKFVSYGSSGQLQGEAGEASDKLHDYAYSMGVQLSDSWYLSRSRNLARGIATQQDYEEEIKKMAKAAFPQWSDQLDAGKTVEDLASPYLSSMSQILELPAGSINLFDSTIRSALNNKDKAGVNEVKPLWQFENELRSDPRWVKTQNAQNSLMQVAHQVLSDFGVSY